jgi:3-hydroxymyristoyl/3-hydroxydecanoyl-(acyl carrier protein) dehydratase
MPGTWFPAIEMLPAEGDGLRWACVVSADLGWFEGHFPGQAVLPAAGLLAIIEHVLRLEKSWPQLVPVTLTSTRFKRLVLPETRLVFHLKPPTKEDSPTHVFTVSDGEGIVCQGKLDLA